MKLKLITEKMQELGFDSGEKTKDEFKQLAGITALRQAQDGTYYVRNWWRGPLLYALVSHYRPRSVLEFGTGRGYGALSMAKASLEQGFECRVWTIDRIPPTTRQLWPIDEGNGPTTKLLALDEVWEQSVSRRSRERISCLTGDSYSVMREWTRLGRPNIDFFFIDGGHDYRTVKHDFIAGLRVANSGAAFLFDDYGKRKRYGVKNLIDNECIPKCPQRSVEVIDTFAGQDLPSVEGQVDHKMALLDTKQIPELNQHFYSTARARLYIISYQIIQFGRKCALPFRTLTRRLLRD
jgi:predicted O-methyltransferase YrrM